MTKIWDTLEDYQEVVAGMNDASSLLTSHRLHHTTRVLTVVTTLMVPLLVVAGVFGMVAVRCAGRRHTRLRRRLGGNGVGARRRPRRLSSRPVDLTQASYPA